MVEDATATLFVDGKAHESRSISLNPCSEKELVFEWKATSGLHCFVLKLDPEDLLSESQEDDNFLIRTLIVRPFSAGHPWLFPGENLAGLKSAMAIRPNDVPPFDPGTLERLKKAYEKEKSESLKKLIEYEEDKKRKAESFTEYRKQLGDLAAGLIPGKVHRNYIERYSVRAQQLAYAYDLWGNTLSEEEHDAIRKDLGKVVYAGAQYHRTRTYGHTKMAPGFPRYAVFRTQGTYIRICGYITGGIMASGYEHPGYGLVDKWTHFLLNCFYYDILFCSSTPWGYYNEGQGYYAMAESRTGASLFLGLGHIGANLFKLWPITKRMHQYYLRTQLPNGWCPPENDDRMLAGASLSPLIYSPLYDEATASAARWSWRHGQPREDMETRLDGAWRNPFKYYGFSQLEKGEATPPPWSPSQLLGDHLIFRSHWGEDAAYLFLSCKHWPTDSPSHDQLDHNQFMLYAKKSFLAVDPGYGDTSAVKSWCRGSKYAHNLVLIDDTPPARAKGVYVYADAAFPENTFTAGGLDFGEALMRGRVVPGENRDLVTHRRSVIFPRRSEYFILIDSLKSKWGKEHEYNSIIQGNTRRPFKSQSNPGDYVSTKGRTVEEIQGSSPDNLTFKQEGGGRVAEWLIENMDKEDVRFRAFFAAPDPNGLSFNKGRGVLGYARYWAGGNRYLEATTKGRDVRYLTMLLPDLVDSAADDISVTALAGSGLRGGGANAAGARMILPGGVTDLVVTQNPGNILTADGKLTTDAEIAFVRLRGEKCELALMARGRVLSVGGRTILHTSTRVGVLFGDLSEPGKAELYLSLPQCTDISVSWTGTGPPVARFIRGDCRPPGVTGAAEKVSCKVAGGMAKLTNVQGAGRLILAEGGQYQRGASLSACPVRRHSLR